MARILMLMAMVCSWSGVLMLLMARMLMAVVFCPQPRPPGPRVSSHYSHRPPVSQGPVTMDGDDECLFTVAVYIL